MIDFDKEREAFEEWENSIGSNIAVNAFALADAMIEEANKRKEIGFPLDEEHK